MANYPIKGKKEGEYFLIGVDYSNIYLDFNREKAPFRSDEINQFQLFNINFGYTKLLKRDWRFGIRISPNISTNLIARQLSINDFGFSGDLVFIKSKKLEGIKKQRLILGVRYSQNGGFPFPIPFVNFNKKISENWSYTVGVPAMNLQYNFLKKNRLKLYAALDGFTANIQRGILLNDLQTAQSINLSLIVGGLDYEYHITNHLNIFARFSNVFSYKSKFRDRNNDNILEINNGSRAYYRTGIRFKI